ncbi:MAG: hypothetical protein JWQ11_4382 [Rhizobacter sp.]|nr:hypothetical protein [Rhizobacter sp.]
MRTNLDLSTLPAWLLIGLGVVLLLEVVLAVLALADLARRPVATVGLGNKWIWVAIIVLVNLLGPILYLAVGRRPAVATDEPRAPKRSSTDIADELYGSSDDAP